MPSLSIVIPVCNDPVEILETLKSIRDTSPPDVETIVIDDASDQPIIVDGLPVKFHRNPTRIGPGASRHLGAEMASGDYLLLIDSHMRFEPGWYDKAIARITQPGREKFVHCASMCGLEIKDTVMEEYERPYQWADLAVGRRCITEFKHGRKIDERTFFADDKQPYTIHNSDIVSVPATARYYGAQMNFYGPNPNNLIEHQTFEAVWSSERPGDDYPLSAMMGACYFYPRKFFFDIGGLKANRQWGSEEPYMSVKTWLAGGEIRMMKGVRIGHKFHNLAVPYKMDFISKTYNKLRSCMTLFSEDEAKFLLKSYPQTIEKTLALEQIRRDRADIEAEYGFNLSIFQHGIQWMTEKFKLEYFLK